jgi:Asp-tRNA(Asn)/Glu-tRNA(Gln) amidotransferase A subunit family amidase
MDRLTALNRSYRAFSHFEPEEEWRNARFTVSVKGNIPVKGLPWTEGSAIFAGRVAQRDAAVVARARRAGGAVIGTTTLSELAMYGVTNPFEPMGLNPWSIERTAGGSSTGAGVAASLGMAQVNIGTDSGGSIRNPACHCGVVGFMPRIGAMPLEGAPNHTPSLSTIGIICRSVGEVEQAYRALADAAPAARRPAGRLLVLRGLIKRMCDDETQALFAQALERLSGFELVDAEIPGWLEGERAAGVVSLYESGQALAQMDLARASDGIRARAAAAAKLTRPDFERAQQACADLKRNVSQALQGADALVTPTWPFAAPLITQTHVSVKGGSVPIDPHRNCFVRAANAIDACAITMPMGLYPTARVPAGLHLTANGGEELRLLALARMVEAAMPSLPAAPPLQSLERRFK